MAISEDQKWQAQQDLETMERADQIKANPERQRRMIAYAEELAIRANQKVASMKESNTQNSKVIRIA